VTPGFKLVKRHVVHFIPFLVSIVYSLSVYIAVAGEQSTVDKDFKANGFYYNNVKAVEDYISILSALFYWLLGLKLVIQYRSWLFSNTSNTDYPTYSWLLNICVSMGLLIGGLVLDISLDYIFKVRGFLHWQVFFAYIAALVYYLGFRGYSLNEKPVSASDIATLPLNKQTVGGNLQVPEKLANEVHTAALHPMEDNIGSLDTAPGPKYPEVELAIVKALAVDKLYLDPELNLAKLASHIGASSAVVSSVINSNLGKSFRELINEYRIEKVKQKLAEPGSAHLSLLGVAYDCGFNSEASFYRIFKTTVGVSPKEYMKQQQSAT
jgi:AraC-like DNA-binding protein